MLVDKTFDPLTRLLVDVTRRAQTSGAQLAAAHRAVGRALAHEVAQRLGIEEVQIDHVTGPSTGVQIKREDRPVFLACLRSGLFVAEGLWECFPESSLVLHRSGQAMPDLPNPEPPVVIVDAVINSGESMEALLQSRLPRVQVVTLVGFRPTMERLAADFPHVDFIAARVSDRSYVGKGRTDTGGRLFGTTNWE